MKYLQIVFSGSLLFLLSLFCSNEVKAQFSDTTLSFEIKLLYSEEGVTTIGNGQYHFFYVFTDLKENEYHFEKPKDNLSVNILKDKNNYGKWLILKLSSLDLENAIVLRVELTENSVTPQLQNSFKVKNSINEMMPVLGSKEIYNLIENKPNVEVVLSRQGGATDFGAYTDVYVVFDNNIELPHRYAVYKIGRIAYADSVYIISESKIGMNCVLFEQDNSYSEEIDYEVLNVIIDISEVKNKEKKYELEENFDIEGDIDSYASIIVCKQNKESE